MGHRTVKRVPLDFNWPMKKVWGGYVRPAKFEEVPCPACTGGEVGVGYSQRGRELYESWYGYRAFHPSDTGSTPFTPETPAVRSRAERNVENAPGYYGTGESAIVREATRLCDLFNGSWSHHLSQEDVDALVDADRLWDFTKRFVPGEGWQEDDTLPHPAAQQVNEWSIVGLGHDSINAWTVIKSRCEREGVSPTCSVCDGHGSTEAYPGQRKESEEWEWEEPPEGDGWQLWETTSEGSPVSPVFPTVWALADWCEDNATWFGDQRWTGEQWLASFIGETIDVDSLLVMEHRSTQ